MTNGQDSRRSPDEPGWVMGDTNTITLFRQQQRRRNLRPGTIMRRQRALLAAETHLGRPLHTATTDELEDWLDSLRLCPSSRYTYVGHLCVFFAWATTAGLCASNPAVDLVRPKLPQRMARPVDEDDMRAALAQADPRMRAWLALAGYAGLRCCEIAAVRREDVQERADPPTLIVPDGKGGKPRVLPMHPVVLEALLDYGLRSGWLWTKQDGRPYPAGTVSTYIRRYLHDIGVETSGHAFRHRFGTMCYRHSLDLVATQHLMGHANPRTTVCYVQLASVRAAEVVGMVP